MMLRKLFIFLLAVVASMAASAAVHTVADVPNVHVADARRYVSDPDGLLSTAMRDSLDNVVRNVWTTSSAELAVVVLDQIDGGDIDTFATELFTAWGMGKKDNSNGVLYLVAIGDRRAVIRTGYGAEGVVPDVLAGRIIRSSNTYFKNGDIDGGVADAVGQVSALLTTPGATEELMSKYANDEASDKDDFFEMWIALSKIISACIFVWFVVQLIATRKLNRYPRYQKLKQMRLATVMFTFLTLGMALTTLIPLLIIMRLLRVFPRKCPNCGARMKRLDEKSDNAYLTQAQDMEERINSVDYDVWLCGKCGEVDILPYVNSSKDYTVCPQCGARACALSADRVIRKPTTFTEGRGEKIYCCRNCRRQSAVAYNIPKLPPVIVVPPTGGGRGGFGGGGFSGGSFGGGSTGGGGASGGW
jgi:uncharacterized protein